MKLLKKIEYDHRGRISAAHGRALSQSKDENKQIEVCDKIVRNGLSVKTAEGLLKDKGH